MPLVPDLNDVLFGKGTAINSHPGNRRLRSLVELQKKNFLKAERKQKRRVAQGIMEELLSSASPQIKFLMEDPNAGRGVSKTAATAKEGEGVHPSILGKEWTIVGPDRVVTKIMKCLRENNSKAGNSISEAGQKNQKRFCPVRDIATATVWNGGQDEVNHSPKDSTGSVDLERSPRQLQCRQAALMGSPRGCIGNEILPQEGRELEKGRDGGERGPPPRRHGPLKKRPVVLPARTPLDEEKASLIQQPLDAGGVRCLLPPSLLEPSWSRISTSSLGTASVGASSLSDGSCVPSSGCGSTSSSPFLWKNASSPSEGERGPWEQGPSDRGCWDRVYFGTCPGRSESNKVPWETSGSFLPDGDVLGGNLRARLLLSIIRNAQAQRKG